MLWKDDRLVYDAVEKLENALQRKILLMSIAADMAIMNFLLGTDDGSGIFFLQGLRKEQKINC